MTDRALLQQALEALELLSKQPIEMALDYADNAIDALRERLAQPVQEPVAHTLNCVCGAVWDIKSDGSEEMAHTPDTTPPQREPLTDEEIWDAYMEIPADFVCNMVDLVDFARAIEAAHGIKENK